MRNPTRQLPLDFAPQPSFARADFLRAAGNAGALDAVEAWPAWPADRLMIVGPEGSGKSHLGAIWSARAGAFAVHAKAPEPALFESASFPPAIFIDDADGVGDAEAALFHMLNAARGAGASVLLTARRRPDFWGLRTPDLLSRLRAAPLIELGSPDDALVEAILVKLLADRQLSADPIVLAYVTARVERSGEALRAFVGRLDSEALARGTRITRALAGHVLDTGDEKS